METKLVKDTLQLKQKMEYFRNELNSLMKGSETRFRNEQVLKMSMALDEMIVEYMKVLNTAKH